MNFAIPPSLPPLKIDANGKAFLDMSADELDALGIIIEQSKTPDALAFRQAWADKYLRKTPKSENPS